MTLHARLTPAAVALVKRFETFHPNAQPTPDGGWSVGYGHTRSARQGAHVSESDAEALLIYDLDIAARAVERGLFAPVSQGQFEALTALCFNLGEPAFLRSSALARVNAGAELDAADEIEQWRRAELGAGAQVVDALVRRRAAEKAHFLGLPDGEATWPSAQLRPLAGPGGDNDPSAGRDPGSPTSAALTAANDVQARLRRLIPEDVAEQDVPLPSETLSEPERFESLAAVASVSAFATMTPREPEVVGPVADEPEIAWEQTPPPFDAPAHDSVEGEDAKPPPVVKPAAVPRAALAPADPSAPRPASVGRSTAEPRGGARVSYLLLALFGAAMFVAAIVIILVGRPGLLGLGLGVLGVLVAVPGLYGLMDVTSAEPTKPETKPFPKAAADTK